MRIVAGRFRGKQLTSPEGQDIRPTSDRVRESLFNILSSRLAPVLEGKRVLDLFAGTGALGLEALSRGAAHATFVETGMEGRALIRGHIEGFGVGGITKLLKRDATDLGPLERDKPFDLIFADPPYGQGLGERALMAALTGGWVAPDALLVLEERTDAEVTLPAGLALDDRRVYGDTAIHFIVRG